MEVKYIEMTCIMWVKHDKFHHPYISCKIETVYLNFYIFLIQDTHLNSLIIIIGLGIPFKKLSIYFEKIQT